MRSWKLVGQGPGNTPLIAGSALAEDEEVVVAELHFEQVDVGRPRAGAMHVIDEHGNAIAVHREVLWTDGGPLGRKLIEELHRVHEAREPGRV